MPIDPTLGAVIVAIIAAVSSVIVALISQYGIRQRIGKPNGHGNVQEALGEIHNKVDDVEAKVDQHVKDHERHKWRIG